MNRCSRQDGRGGVQGGCTLEDFALHWPALDEWKHADTSHLYSGNSTLTNLQGRALDGSSGLCKGDCFNMKTIFAIPESITQEMHGNGFHMCSVL